MKNLLRERTGVLGVVAAIVTGFIAGCLAAYGGYVYGRREQAREVWKLLELTSATPEKRCQDGDVAVTTDPPVIWQRMCGRVLSFRPLPPSDAVTVVRLFGPSPPSMVEPPPPSPPATTAQTPPAAPAPPAPPAKGERP